MKSVIKKDYFKKIIPKNDLIILLALLSFLSCSIINNESEIRIYSCHEQVSFIEPASQCLFNTKLDYFRGIWYGQTKLENGRFKYAGGLGTYTSHHGTSAFYDADSEKTFFTYGGTRLDYNFDNSSQVGPDQLYIMISSFDHKTGILEKPTLIFDKWTNDPHDNPVLNIDLNGNIIVYAPSHGNLTTPSYILKSTIPASIDSFEVIEKSLFAYPQPQMDKNGDGVFFYTSYENGRTLKFRKYIGGELQKNEEILSSIQAGHYQVTSRLDSKIGTAFNFIPRPEGSDYRSNLYYFETLDNGDTWQDINGNIISLPVNKINNTLLIKDYKKEGKLVFVMDISFDLDSNPVILYNVSSSPFPDSSKADLMVAFYQNQQWNIRTISSTDHNYNMGTIQIVDSDWAVIVPTDKGPQENAAGGELVYWKSSDNGFSWEIERRITDNSSNNNNYVKKVKNARSEFSYIWADGNAEIPSVSNLYYTDIRGLKPVRME
ncbi:MAG: BNR-4 repeat-containing protein [Balneolaceae bacterium]